MTPVVGSPRSSGFTDLMARLGHDSEWTAMIHQHEARGEDKAITDAIDAHVQTTQIRKDAADEAA
jgi:hypothetical protein